MKSAKVTLFRDPDLRQFACASYATQEEGVTALVNIIRIPCFGRRMTIGRASIVWPGAN
jgi:hypothetical protein